MYIRLWLSSQRWLRLQGIVLYHLEQIGFGLRFADLTPQDESAIMELIEQRASPASSNEAGNEQPE